MPHFVTAALLAFVFSVSAVPITPSAPELQRRVEQFRLEGFKEYEIAKRVYLPVAELPAEHQSLLSGLPKLQSLLQSSTSNEPNHDISGDIAPGSLEAPQILPRATALQESALEGVISWLRREDMETKRLAYEGKELELRRPTGMRHWGSEDKWRLF